MGDARLTITVRIPPELHEQLREAAEERGLSVNYLLIKAIEDFIPRLIPPAEWRITR